MHAGLVTVPTAARSHIAAIRQEGSEATVQIALETAELKRRNR